MLKINRSIRILFIILIIIIIDFSLYAEKNTSSWDGSRSIPVHRIPIMDKNNRQIIPTEPYPLPYSTRFTCAPCHDYDKILTGLHFNEGRPGINPGRPGEPWFWVDEKTGTILPVSSRKWPGTYGLEEAGLTPWRFTTLFGRHMTGGGLADPGDRDVSPESRWEVSGVLEINCLGCHNVSRIQGHSEWAKQIMRENFRWAATAASSLGEVGGMASRLPNTWDIYDGPNPDDTEYAVVPTVKYDRGRFDSKHRVFFDIMREPGDERCLTCHSTAVVGEERFEVDRDVHAAAGMKCVHCHRNDLSHQIIRGYEGETTAKQGGDFTCRGCHIGEATGRLGAPWPEHKGLPAVHFDRLSCTVCHSGPLPGEDPVRVRTSRANRLGIYGIAQWFTGYPHIVEPVYKKGIDGKIAPFRLTWPAFWAVMAGDKIAPLQPEIISGVGEDILNCEERAAGIFLTLAANPELKGEPVFAVSGKLYRRSIDGLLDVSPFPGEKSEDIQWLVKTEKEISPLIPVFDTAAEQLELDIEVLITKTLEALTALQPEQGKPALTFKDKYYHIVDGYLVPEKHTGEPSPNPRLCWLQKGKTIPLISPFQLRTIIETAGEEETLTEEQVDLMLKVLSDLPPAGPPRGQGINTRGASKKTDIEHLSSAPRAAGLEKAGQKLLFRENTNFVYISGGRLFKLDEEGKLVSSGHEAAEPVSWPLAHDVRPARLALGAKGCQDCHRASSPFFFAGVKGSGPLKSEQREVRAMHRFMGKDKYYETLFGLSFTFRPVLKIILFIAIVLIASILLIIFLLAIGKFSGLISKGATPSPKKTKVKKVKGK